MNENSRNVLMQNWETSHGTNSTVSVCMVKVKNDVTTLAVANVEVVQNKIKLGKKALIDTGSQKTFIKDSTTKVLGLKPVGKVKLKVKGFLKNGESKDFEVVNVTIKLERKFVRLHALITLLAVVPSPNDRVRITASLMGHKA